MCRFLVLRLDDSSNHNTAVVCMILNLYLPAQLQDESLCKFDMGILR